MAKKIKNFKELATTEPRNAVLEILEAGLQEIDTEVLIRKNVAVTDGYLSIENFTIPLEQARRIFVVGVGKCSLAAAKTLEDILGKRISGGAVLDVRKEKLSRMESFAGTHPLPSKQNVEATKKIIALLAGLGEHDLVIFVISGGGSTLLCQPKIGTYEDEAKLVACLTRAGADIKELNTVRKHLSLARGGHLAKYAFPATSIALIFSDVPGDDISFVASGPTVKDETTVRDAQDVLRKYAPCGLGKLGLSETPKEEAYFQRMRNIIIASSEIALDAMGAAARQLGFCAGVRNNFLSGEASAMGSRLMKELGGCPPKSVLICGGETTVMVRGSGKGGRNQELVLGAFDSVQEGKIIAALSSDGRDNTEFAGALADATTKEKAKKLGLDAKRFLRENASYDFFKKTGDYILTGDTGSNVSDFVVAMRV